MASIATLASQLGFLQKFLGIAAKEGLPDAFYQRVIDDPNFRSDFAAWARGRLNPGVTATVSTDANRFELSVGVQIAALRRANDEEGWGIPAEDMSRLAETAPEWPKGRLAFRSLRIRFGEGDEGVARTCRAHAIRAKKLFGKYFDCWDNFLSDNKRGQNKKLAKHLRLIVGNHTHKPTVEWVTIDLDASCECDSIVTTQGPTWLADELFVFAWMFPDYIRSIDYETNPGLIAAGYQLNVPECTDKPWQHIPCVYWDREYEEARLSGYQLGHSSVGYSKPVIRKQ